MSHDDRPSERIAFATYRDAAQIQADDDLVADLLRARGHVVDACVWDDEGVDWRVYDRVVLRSPWDYQAKFAAFAEWIRALDEAPATRLINGASLVLDNIDKRYLVELGQRGTPVIETALIERGQSVELGALCAERGWRERVVVKPAISASAWQTWVVDTARIDERDRARLASILSDRAAIVQPFVREFVDDGEWSLVFFAGEPSHALHKRPGAGDFRVQEELGGSTQLCDAPAALWNDASAIVRALPHSPCYARVDGVERDGRFVLAELELIEPFLWLGLAPGSAERFANAILAA